MALQPPAEELQAALDAEHLRMLSVAHLVDGAMYLLFSPFGLFYALMGVFFSVAIAQAPPQQGGPPPPPFVGLIFAAVGLALFGAFAIAAALKFTCAYCLHNRRSRALCIVVAAVSCLAVPYGTAIGVWTFLLLLRPSVAQKFDEAAAARSDRSLLPSAP